MYKFIGFVFIVFIALSCRNKKAAPEQKEKRIEGFIMQGVQVAKDEPQNERPTYDEWEQRVADKIRSVCDTSYVNNDTASWHVEHIECPFIPYILVVANNQVRLLNQNFDSIYFLNTGMEIHTASWSPFAKNEIYFLAKDRFSISASDSAKYPYLPYSAMYNLKLYRYQLDSLRLYEITTLYNKGLPLITDYFELGMYFPFFSLIEFDIDNEQIQYDMVSVMHDPMFFENFGTAVIDLNKHTTVVGEFQEFSEHKTIGEAAKIYPKASGEEYDYKAKVEGEKIKVFDYNSSSDTLYIPKAEYDGNVQVDLDDVEEDGCLSRLQINFFVDSDTACAIYSPYMEHEMGELLGGVYLLNNTTYVQKILFEELVIGYSVDLFLLENEFNIFRTYGDLYVFDANYKQKVVFSEVQHYELAPGCN